MLQQLENMKNEEKAEIKKGVKGQPDKTMTPKFWRGECGGVKEKQDEGQLEWAGQREKKSISKVRQSPSVWEALKRKSILEQNDLLAAAESVGMDEAPRRSLRDM